MSFVKYITNGDGVLVITISFLSTFGCKAIPNNIPGFSVSTAKI